MIEFDCNTTSILTSLPPVLSTLIPLNTNETQPLTFQVNNEVNDVS